MANKALCLVCTLALFALAGCRTPATPASDAAPQVLETAPAAASVPTPASEEAAPPPAPSPQSPAPAASASLPAPTLFNTPWDDRAPFAAGLIEAEQGALAQLPGASVYHLDLTLSPNMTHLSGKEEVRYTNRENVPLAEIVFRLFPNLLGGSVTVSNLTLNGQPIAPVYSLLDSAMSVPLSAPLSPGEQAVLAMEFAVTVPTTEEVNYASFAYLDGIAALAHVYPIIAVYDDEGWNAEIPPTYGDVVYADSSFYLARVTAPADQVLVGSGVEIETETGSGTQTVTFAAGPMRDFYLAASNHYQRLSRTVGDSAINSYAPPEVSESAEIGLNYAVNAMQSFNARFGSYPFVELDLIATPTLAGGIEYPGVIVVALSLYKDRGTFFEGATAHEVAHQWFYSVVGNDQLDDPWLDEALTQYVTWLYYRDMYGQPGDDGFRKGMESRWQRLNRADIPIGLPVSGYDEREYGSIVYGRGPLFFDDLAGVMGQEAMDSFLRDYYRTNQWGIATPENLKQLAEKACECDLTPAFEAAVYKK